MPTSPARPIFTCQRCKLPVSCPVWLENRTTDGDWHLHGEPSGFAVQQPSPFHPICAELALGGGKLE
jgi:hypothetical protein